MLKLIYYLGRDSGRMHENDSEPSFKHVQLSPLRWVSICLKCYRTAASETAEEDLFKPERSHVCKGIFSK